MNMDEETTVPSGPEWEVVLAEGSDSSIRQVPNVNIQELQKSRKYTFNVLLDSNNELRLKLTSYAKIME